LDFVVYSFHRIVTLKQMGARQQGYANRFRTAGLLSPKRLDQILSY
jgi:hypothetical protein